MREIAGPKELTVGFDRLLAMLNEIETAIVPRQVADIGGFRVYTNRGIPPGEVQLRNDRGEIVGRIVNVKL